MKKLNTIKFGMAAYRSLTDWLVFSIDTQSKLIFLFKKTTNKIKRRQIARIWKKQLLFETIKIVRKIKKENRQVLTVDNK